MLSHGKNRRRRVLPWALGVVVLIAAGVVGALIANSVNSPSNASTTGSPATASSCNVTSIADQELPSVVTIFAGSGTSSGVGSGEESGPLRCRRSELHIHPDSLDDSPAPGARAA
jgi:uncharacterized protein (UPF0333 family)